MHIKSRIKNQWFIGPKTAIPINQTSATVWWMAALWDTVIIIKSTNVNIKGKPGKV